MGNGTVQGRAWGQRARAWAELQEHNNLPLHQVVLEAARIGRGTVLLDAGCGAGLSSALATFRGATVTAVDAAPALLAIARARIPGLAVYEADLETLPFADGAFDAAIAINSLFFCADAAAATREVARTVRPGGLLVATCWAEPARCAYLALTGTVCDLLPPPPAGTLPPFGLAAPGVWEALFAAAGVETLERGEVDCTFVFRTAEEAWLAHRAVPVVEAAIARTDEETVRTRLRDVDARFTRADGSIAYPNWFVWVRGRKR